ncbi:MAG TPA: iron ABC transporter permease [Pseudonocardiaceae bacterium]|jgi:iron complex transport system permease protein|nr:iron ABC transporter permease [Pseudonocardiaceae bacterium]
MTSSPNTLPAGTSSPDGQGPVPKSPRSNRFRVTWVVVALLVLLVGGAAWSMTLGAEQLGIGDVLHGLFHNDGTADLIIRDLRLPRVVLAVVVGAALSVAGALMQAVAANPLAAPEIMGVNGGAVFVIVLGATVFPSLAGAPTLLLAFVGAGVAGTAVMVLAGAGRGRTSPVRLALAGVTMTSLLVALTQVLIIFNENSTDSVLFWLVGGINAANWSDVTSSLPWIAPGLLASFALARSLNLLALGEDMARGLGQNVERIRIFGSILVIVLCAAAVSVAGPVAFIGLIIPHIMRRLVGSSYVVLLPLCAIAGAVLLEFADIASRFLNPPYEEPAGVVTALIGGPIFVYLARRQKANA